MKVIDVACAIINIDGKTLVVQRSVDMKLPLKWEFPGGKIEVGESDEHCIKREIREELNIEIEIVERLTPTHFDYDSFAIRLVPFIANYIHGEIKLKEHSQYLLLDKNELLDLDLDWAEADVSVVNAFVEL